MFNQQVISYISLAGLALLLILSWMYLYQSSEELSEMEHGALQEKFQSAISDYVKKNHPKVIQITFHKTWTENTSDRNRVKVYFSYSLTVKDQTANNEMVIDGTASLNRKSGNRWLLTDFTVTDSEVEFSEPLVIKAPDLKETTPSDPASNI